MKNIIILGNGVDWCEKTLDGFKKYNNIILFNDRQIVKNKIVKHIIKLQYSKTINKKFNVPFKCVWYKYICRSIGLDDEVECILIYDHNPYGGDKKLLTYIRKNYPQVKLVYIFTNIVKFSAAYEMSYVTELKYMYDVIFAFDPVDSQKYNFSYSPLIYDVDDMGVGQLPNKKAFYVGQAKDRFKLLIGVFERLKVLDIDTDFHIVNVRDADQVYKDEIKYNRYITYDEAIERIKGASCLVDIIQGDSAGLTIKVCEAVCYNKKLITTNKHVAEYSFYDPRFIMIIENPNDISKDFFEQNLNVQYKKEAIAYFSADSFLERLKNEIKNRK